MVEAYRDLASLPYDEAFVSRSVELDELREKHYKKIVDNRSALPQLEACTVSMFDQIIVQNVEKASKLVNIPFAKTNPAECYDSLSQIAIMEAQAVLLSDDGMVSVLCTCIWFVIDYRPQKMRRHLKAVASQG